MNEMIDALQRTVLLCRALVEPHEATDAQIVEALTQTSICIAADEMNLTSGASQSAVVALVGQVAALGSRVRLCMPEVRILHQQPPIAGELLRAGLVDYVADLIPGCNAEVVNEPDAADIVFAIGSSPIGDAVDGWRMSGGRWVGRIGLLGDQVTLWNIDFPIGALISATLATTEVFKSAMRRLRLRVGAQGTRDELDRVDRVEVALAKEHVAADPLQLGDIDIISGGAISNAFLHALLRVPDVSAKVRMIEPDKLARSNLNRYALARRSFEREFKTVMLRRWATPSVPISCIEHRFEPSTVDALLPLAPQVVVGVDDVKTRWFVQSLDPEWLVVGATAHFLIIVSEHVAGMPCAGCMHPRDDGVEADIPTVSFVSYWAGLVAASRLLRRAAGDTIAPDEQSITLRPLRLDARYSRLMTLVPIDPKCPVGCTASSTRRAS